MRVGGYGEGEEMYWIQHCCLMLMIPGHTEGTGLN